MTETNNTEIINNNFVVIRRIDNKISIIYKRIAYNIDNEEFFLEEENTEKIFSDIESKIAFHYLKNKYELTKLEKDTLDLIFRKIRNEEKLSINEDKEESVKSKLIKYSESMTLFHDIDGHPYANFVNNNKKEIHSIFSKYFSEYLSLKYFIDNKDAPSDQELKSAISVLSAMAKISEEHELHMRLCKYEGDIWFDLGNWEAVKITKDGWEIIQDVPIIFRHYNNYVPTIKDTTKIKKSGNIKKLLEFVTLKEDKQDILYLCHTLSLFIPDIQPVAASYCGRPGSKKTTKRQIQQELADCRILNVQDMPDDPKELAKMLSNYHCVCLDNASNLSGKQSDVIAKAVTGGGISERLLYTNNDQYETKYKCSIGLTSIEGLLSKPDVVERSIIYEELPQDDETRKEERQFWLEFNEAKGEILGGIFNIISKSMNIIDHIELTRKPRMADFAKWCCAFALEMGYTKEDFLEAYTLSSIKLNNKLVDTNLVCSMIVKFMESKTSWEGNMSQLLLQLKTIAPIMGIDEYSPGFPKDHVWLGRKISEFENNLSLYGIRFTEINKAKHINRIVNNRPIEKSYVEEEPFVQQDLSIQTNCKICNKLEFTSSLSACAGGGYICKECTNEHIKTPEPQKHCVKCNEPVISNNKYQDICQKCLDIINAPKPKCKNGHILEDGKCHYCERNEEYLKNIKEKEIIQPCSRCGKETKNKLYSVIDGEFVCSECEPDIEQKDPEIVEEDEQYNEYIRQIEIEEELSEEIEIPDEIF